MRQHAAAARVEEEARALAESVRAMAEIRRDEYRRKRFASLVLAAGLGITLAASSLLALDDSAALLAGDVSVTTAPAVTVPWVGAAAAALRWVTGVALVLTLAGAGWWSMRMRVARHAAERVIAASR
ncbi:hypothetical protein [Cellulomonas sp. Y8]|uniref:hypothetical protein n=1 Tax=Cellulomonas sp. Y8 TaxID=2591145 RepID=UPI0011CBFE03|nr:hypothetical protein [Cellulomonas sp. Y8]